MHAPSHSQTRGRHLPQPSLTFAVLCAGLLPTFAWGQNLSIASPDKGVQCESVEVSGNTMTCDRDGCVVSGQASLVCGGLDLWADDLELLLGPDQSFAGARARGNVLLVERDTVMTCSQLTLSEDRISGRIDSATFHIKEDRRKVDDRGIPSGRDTTVFRGDIERNAEGRLHIENADFTMCDCGDEPPSWLLTASSIDATVDKRATLWWPQLWLNPLGLGQIPVTPPLAPLSVALEERAGGLLAPEIKLLGGLWPMIDVPVFVPLGRSWDITVTPGVRFDWGRHKLTPISTWGAPRLGGRVRYAPIEGTAGEARVSWTWDRKAQAARIFEEAMRGNFADPEDLLDDANQKRVNGRAALEHRVAIELEHKSELGQQLTWLVAAQWVSDDLMPGDFSVALEDRVANFTASRTELLWRRPGLGGLVAADHLLVLNNSEQVNGTFVADYSNISGREAPTSQRGPFVELRLLPTEIAPGFQVEANASFVRYGPWTSARSPDRVIGAATAGAAWRDRMGPLSLEAGLTLDTMWFDPTTDTAATHAMTIVDTGASTRLGRALGDLYHLVEPSLRYRGLPWLSSQVPTTPALDPRLGRHGIHQGVVGISQSLWRKHSTHLQRLASLVISQPLALDTGELLQTQIDVDSTVASTNLSAWTDIDFARNAAVQEIGSRISRSFGPVSLSGEYARWNGRADRFRRSLYDLAAEGPPLGWTSWVHMLNAGTSIRIGDTGHLSYSTSVLLSTPRDCKLDREAIGGGWSGQCLQQNELDREPGITVHRIGASYRSPFNCWEVAATLQIPPDDPLGNIRGSISLAVGGYALGSN